MTSRAFKLLRNSMLAAAGTLALASMGGCPQAQTPNTNTQTNENSSGTTTDNTSQDSSATPRPIPPVVVETNTGTVVVTPVTPPVTGGTGTGSGGSQTGPIAVNVSSPSAAVRSRGGFQVSVNFSVTDSAGALAGAELVVANDANADGTADGAPVLSRTVAAHAGANTVTFNTDEVAGLLNNGVGRFVLGIRLTTIASQTVLGFATGAIIVDSTAPTAAWNAPLADNLVNTDANWTVRLNTGDNAAHTVRVMLDQDQTPGNGNEFEFVPNTTFAAGDAERVFTVPLIAYPPGTYFFYTSVSDGVEPPLTFYAQAVGAISPVRLAVTRRLIGTFDVGTLANANQNRGGILQGINFNDLAGSSISSVPDIDGDGRDEVIIGSRYGKSYLIQNNGVGFGEGYMIYGGATRITGIKKLNAVGQAGLPGVIFTGMRTPRAATNPPPPPSIPANQRATWSTRWTAGLSDITVIPDMDGDNLPEIVFSFPRVESINIGEGDPSIQHPELTPDLPSMGDLEYNAFYGLPPVWNPNEAQFTRGGVVIVSSHCELLQNRNLLNRKSDRVIDLHEIGQLFSQMQRPGLAAYIRQVIPIGTRCVDCDFQPPAGWTEGTADDPNTADTDETVAGTCGDDGCEGPDPVLNGHLQDGREQEMDAFYMLWDVSFTNQGPGGFLNDLTIPPVSPPLVNYTPFPFTPLAPFPLPAYIPTLNAWPSSMACALGCEVTNAWYSWGPTLPGTILQGTATWTEGGNPFQTPNLCYNDNPPGPFNAPPDPACDPVLPPCAEPNIDVASGGVSAWSGFYGPQTIARIFSNGNSYTSPIGARILGQKVEDQFGTSVSSDGTWLYITAPQRTANDAPYTTDIPALAGTRSGSGVVYQLRVNAPTPGGGPTRTQLWIEYAEFPVDTDGDGENDAIGINTYPSVDVEALTREDYTMPVPHTYVIETVGSLRGQTVANFTGTYEGGAGGGGGGGTCPPAWSSAADDLVEDTDGVQISDASAVANYVPYPTGTSGYFMDRVPQIVGPHAGAHMAFVRALGDLNDDGIRDFAVGSPDVKKTSIGAGGVLFDGATVGSIFIVYGRPTGVEGDYLLDQLALDISDPDRLSGVLLQGASAGEKLARVVDDAGDFNNDGISDVIVGNESANGNAGEAVVILGSPSLVSPAGGWTVADAVTGGQAIRFFSTNASDLVGANVSGAGDVDGDLISDILISAPGAEGGKGAVYLIYGSATLTGSIDLARIGTVDAPGAKFVGRTAGDRLGAGSKDVTNTDPAGNPTTAQSRGLSTLGDIDGDGKADYAISSMLADPDGRTDAGEVYILYGRGDR